MAQHVPSHTEQRTERTRGRLGSGKSERAHCLEESTRALRPRDVLAQLFAEDMRRDFDVQKARVGNELMAAAARADEFFDEELQLTNALALLRSGQLQRAFQDRVLGDTTRQIDDRVRDVVDWMASKTQSQARNQPHCSPPATPLPPCHLTVSHGSSRLHAWPTTPPYGAYRGIGLRHSGLRPPAGGAGAAGGGVGTPGRR